MIVQLDTNSVLEIFRFSNILPSSFLSGASYLLLFVLLRTFVI